MITKIEHREQLMAIIVPHDYRSNGINFFTPNELSQQLAYMQHPAGHEIQPHKHKHRKREVSFTQEVLIIKKGKLRVDFYDNNNDYLESYILSGGDIILLVSGGHGFEVLEEIEMIEVKQGPYYGDDDKKRFPAVNQEEILLKN